MAKVKQLFNRLIDEDVEKQALLYIASLYFYTLLYGVCTCTWYKLQGEQFDIYQNYKCTYVAFNPELHSKKFILRVYCSKVKEGYLK